jgi:uncharacterized protein YeaO (DUF488 family)
MLLVKRVYEPQGRQDVALSDALRRRFGHDPAKWDEFRRRYWAELGARREAWHSILESARRGTVTLLYSTGTPSITALWRSSST